ncbi:uncharacterized protein BDZ99DRAFT_473026 [Mytilinidion resinicola]|uniref:Uncharacterized protein n=1 Tax=Mytilinidion resinicola TaxID=574789 RepID=A0A6A6Z0X7_9PEZI|nr:uncharacterized protein BDZ99DRAFT_473026 [Mytilinidion resinicola]KAF2813877.1 hypothetical protein BDZ99DRAFT_473026 [Mytilinidion resinicola]
MAPSTAEPTRSTQSKASRPTPVMLRIVPAIPLAFSRAPRAPRASVPTTPENTGPSDAPPDHTEASTAVEKLPDEQRLTEAQAPLTPESKASALSQDRPAEDSPGSSSSRVSGVHVEETQNTRGSTVSDEQTEATELNFSPVAPEPTRYPIKELPPPFYPAEHTSTPNSATSSSTPSFQPPMIDTGIHHPRPSTGSIIFGGFPDSSNSSPAPPLGMTGYHPPPPGFAPGNYAPPQFFTPGHSHHPSDPNGHIMFPPMNMPPPVAYGYRRDPPPQHLMGQHQPWYPHANHAPYQMVQQEPYIPLHEPALTNGTAKPSRSASQTSSQTHEGELKHLPEATGLGQVSRLQNGIRHRAVDPEVETSRIARIDYLYSRFGNPEFADRLLQIGFADTAPFFAMPVHSVIVADSKTLALAFSAATERYQDGVKITQLFVDDKFITQQAVTEALKYLYGAPLPIPAKFSQGLQAFDRNAEQVDPYGLARQRMDQALSFSAAGAFLRLPEVANRGIDIALHVLRWDNIERALEFALQGGLSPPWRDAQSESPSIHQPTYDPYSSSLLRGIMAFISLSFPSDFRLNNIAPQLSGSPLIPNLMEPRPSTHHPRLSMIRFGQVPLEDTPRPTFVMTLLSSILLSLPFSVLRSLFDNAALGGKLGWPKVVEVMKSVIEEREDRRKKALEGHSKGALPSGADQQLVENLQWEERVDQSDKVESGFCVARSRRTANGQE